MSRARGVAAHPSRPSGVLRWRGGDLSFELSSSDSEVLDRACVVFGPWLSASMGDERRTVRFHVEQGGASPRWRVVRTGNGAGTIAESIDLALAAVEYGAVAELFADTGLVTLHAALLSRGDRGIVLVGPKESGKSTLACALHVAGWRLHSDDTALIEGGRVRGIPRRVSLRASSRELLGPRTWERILILPGTTSTRNGVLFHPAEALPGKAPTSVDPVAVIFLARRGVNVGPARLEPLDAGRALVALAAHSNRRDAGIGRALEALQPLADRVRAYDLNRGDIASMIDRVEEAVAP